MRIQPRLGLAGAGYSRLRAGAHGRDRRGLVGAALPARRAHQVDDAQNQGRFEIMKIPYALLALIPMLAVAQNAPVLHPDDVATTTVAPGVLLKELTGRTTAPGARSTRASVAFFHLEP